MPTSNFQLIRLLDLDCWYKFILNDKQCRSRSVCFFRSQLIWIYTVCKPGISRTRVNFFSQLKVLSFYSYFYTETYCNNLIIILQRPFFLDASTHFSIWNEKKMYTPLLTHLYQVDSSTTVKTSLFPIAGCLVSFYHYICIMFYRTLMQTG